MPRTPHRHRTALLGVVLVAGAPLLAAGAARADIEESGQRVTFSGSGLLGVSCAANPSTGSVTLAAETALRVVNRTGHRATLLLDGVARGEIAKDSGADVLFHRGPVSLSLKPHCVITEQRSVRVQVIAARPAIRPARPDGGSTPPAADEGGRQDAPPPDTGGDRDDRGDDGGGSGLGRAATRDAGNERATDPGSRENEPDPALDADEPAREAETADEDSTPAPVVPTDDLAAPADGLNLAAEPLSSVEPISEDGPIGLLALIATVCVLGVSAGAIRAILAQRASRAGFA